MGLKIYKNYQCAPLAPTKTAQLYDMTAIKKPNVLLPNKTMC